MDVYCSALSHLNPCPVSCVLMVVVVVIDIIDMDIIIIIYMVSTYF